MNRRPVVNPGAWWLSAKLAGEGGRPVRRRPKCRGAPAPRSLEPTWFFICWIRLWPPSRSTHAKRRGGTCQLHQIRGPPSWPRRTSGRNLL